VHQQVMVRVLEVDLPRKRISLSLKTGSSAATAGPKKMDKKKSERRPEKGTKPQGHFFNNPFADAFGKKQS
jgi:predicted RNA-binding protein with RPS1 domain